MNETTNALLPCPCCKANAHCEMTISDGHFVLCEGCGLRTALYAYNDREQMYADWNRRPSSPAPVKTNHELHREIMNLPCEKDGGITFLSNPYIAYKEGHKQARHAAAELALQYSPAPVNARLLEVAIAMRDHIQGKNVTMDAGYIDATIHNASQPQESPATAPVNTQGLREALHTCLKCISSGDYVIVNGKGKYVRDIVTDALAQAEQEQPNPTIGLSILDTAEAIQNEAKGARVGLQITVTLDKAGELSREQRADTRIIAWADTSGYPTAGAYSLPGIVGAMIAQLSQPQ